MQRAVAVGCGAMSRTWFEAAAQIEDLAIVGLVDLDFGRARACADQFCPDAAVGTDLAAILDQTKPDIVFDIAVPSARHQIVALALSRGCHVLSEKPMAETLDQAHDLVALAERQNRVHAIVQNRRYLEAIRRIRRFLAAGTIGETTSLHCDFFVGPHFGGFREEMQHVLLLDMAIHTFDAARFLAGADPVSVYAEEWEPQNSWYRQGSSAVAVFRFASGAVFTYRGSWCADGLHTSWESAWRIVGTKGTLLWDGFDDFRAEALDPGPNAGLFAPTSARTIPPSDPDDRIGGHVGVMTDFFRAVRGGVPPETAGHANIRTLAMVFAAIESAGTGRRVAISV